MRRARFSGARARDAVLRSEGSPMRPRPEHHPSELASRTTPPKSEIALPRALSPSGGRVPKLKPGARAPRFARP
eukprot:13039711-Alexandrium_andersonii.AAC.1